MGFCHFKPTLAARDIHDIWTLQIVPRSKVVLELRSAPGVSRVRISCVSIQGPRLPDRHLTNLFLDVEHIFQKILRGSESSFSKHSEDCQS